MKLFILIILLFPFLAVAQTDTTVVYKQQYAVKGFDKPIILDCARQFIKNNRKKFFLASSYQKLRIDTLIDTSGYGFFESSGDPVISPCLFIYIAGGYDVVRGDILFTGEPDKAGIILTNVRYTKYEKKNGRMMITKEGYYKDLDMCKHCNVSGIKVAEVVNKGFVQLSLAYHEYLKNKQKNYSREIIDYPPHSGVMIYHSGADTGKVAPPKKTDTNKQNKK